MPVLTVTQNERSVQIPFSGTPILDNVLSESGFSFPHPCGGRGICGKCAVTVSGAVSSPDDAEKQAGTRLSCRVRLLGDASVILPENHGLMRIESSEYSPAVLSNPMNGRFGGAVDIGTTTVALRLYDLQSGSLIGISAMLNPQTSVSADVMGRIDAACHGKLPLLQSQIFSCIETLIAEAAGDSRINVDTLVISGNTTMLYLLTGRDPISLSHAPFEADTLFDIETEFIGRHVYLPPCISAFVGADISSALLSSDIFGRDGVFLLCDIGTNGEIALLRNGELFVTSTAAGPAFEGVGISCGCMGISGAIDHVWISDGSLKFSTIDNTAPIGLCGSGLIDAVASGLSLELIDETGAMEDDEIALGCIKLLPEDIRALQLAKAAISAGIATLLDEAGVSADDIDECIISGGFGSYLNPKSAAAIGLIPSVLIPRLRTIGNGSLDGASQVLLDVEKRNILRQIANTAKHINLGGNSKFNNYYIEKMMFE